ncbi:uncharacterized protein E0L32_011626 [Thyridium curvatum]|uniref:Uncharacterized protein n=1 Tax=Thyridium curvatum TaxID=1093900 RepID=A0A507BMK0_9PEZI|nr:uncharacterized protein E0L32_011626 [Thyridium curvatum]TPX18441.1 hypothetical protein E0L32_011626 [Thyridium curvatum]
MLNHPSRIEFWNLLPGNIPGPETETTEFRCARECSKGSSHRFPRIRLGSSKRGTDQSSPRQPARAALQAPAPSPTKLRSRQRTVLRRRRRPGKVRVSFSHTSASGVSWPKKRGCRGRRNARPQTKASKVESWVGDVTRHLLVPKDSGPYPCLDRSQIGRPQLQDPVFGFDGHNSSRPTDISAQYRSVQPPLHGSGSARYWGVLPPPPLPPQASPCLDVETRPAGTERTFHPSTLELDRPDLLVDAQDGSVDPSGAVYVPTPTQPIAHSRDVSRLPATPLRAPPRPGTMRTSRRDKRLGMADPAVWESVTRTLSQQHRLSSLVSPESPGLPENRSPSLPSRTSSQRIALDRFCRELTRYARAAGAFGKAPQCASSSTQTRNSLHTIKELLPYHEQFKAAGLSVTSTEQMGKRVQKRKIKRHERKKAAIQPRSQIDGGSTSSNRSSRSSNGLPPASRDDLAFLLVDPVPPPKRRGTDTTKKKHMSWIRRKPRPGSGAQTTRLPQVLEEEHHQLPDVSQVETTGHGTPSGPTPLAFSPIVYDTPPPVPKKSMGRAKTASHSIKSEGTQRSSHASTVQHNDKDLPAPPGSVISPGYHDENAAKLQRHGTSTGRNKPGRRHARDAQTQTSLGLALLPTNETIGLLYAESSNAQPPVAVSPPMKSRQQNQVPVTAPFSPSRNASAPVLDLPFTWRYAVSGTSSFERALDAVVQKLDDMDNDSRRGPPTPPPKPSEPRTMLPPQEQSQRRGQDAAGRDRGYRDHDISDRDVLKGLKMAVSAACDEDLDAWIRSRTGLRLRRFLADLTVFDDLGQEAERQRRTPGSQYI